MLHPVIGLTSFVRESSDGRRQICGNAKVYDAIKQAGGVVIMIPPQLAPDEVAVLLDRLDGIVLPGGVDVDPTYYGETPHPKLGSIDPERDRAEIMLVRAALERSIPLLGICRGMQILNVALGGNLYQDLDSQRPDVLKHNRVDQSFNFLSHPIMITENSRFYTLVGATIYHVNSIHHQAIDRLGYSVQVVARAPDQIPEAIEIEGHPFAIAVQYHPEELAYIDPSSTCLFSGLIGATR